MHTNQTRLRTAAPDDGCRVLVDKLWPRVRKDACITTWAKEITPSPELRTWYHADRRPAGRSSGNAGISKRAARLAGRAGVVRIAGNGQGRCTHQKCGRESCARPAGISRTRRDGDRARLTGVMGGSLRPSGSCFRGLCRFRFHRFRREGGVPWCAGKGKAL